MDAKTLEYMGKRVDAARQLTANREEIERLVAEFSGPTKNGRSLTVKIRADNYLDNLPEPLRRVVDPILTIWVLACADACLADIRSSLDAL